MKKCLPTWKVSNLKSTIYNSKEKHSQMPSQLLKKKGVIYGDVPYTGDNYFDIINKS